MKAVWYERGGPAAEVLQCGEMDAPEPGEGEVRVKIVFSAANPHDTKRRAAGNEVPEQGRIIPHSDGSGPSAATAWTAISPARRTLAVMPPWPRRTL